MGNLFCYMPLSDMLLTIPMRASYKVLHRVHHSKMLVCIYILSAPLWKLVMRCLIVLFIQCTMIIGTPIIGHLFLELII